MRIQKALLAVLLAFMGAWVSPALSFERTGVVVDTMTAGLYTYLEVDTASGRYWAAAPKMKLAVGDQVDVAPGSEMKDFFSHIKKSVIHSMMVRSMENAAARRQKGARSSGRMVRGLGVTDSPDEVSTIDCSGNSGQGFSPSGTTDSVSASTMTILPRVMIFGSIDTLELVLKDGEQGKPGRLGP